MLSDGGKGFSARARQQQRSGKSDKSLTPEKSESKVARTWGLLG